MAGAGEDGPKRLGSASNVQVASGETLTEFSPPSVVRIGTTPPVARRGDTWVGACSTEQTVPTRALWDCRRRERADRSVRAAISSPQTGVKPAIYAAKAGAGRCRRSAGCRPGRSVLTLTSETPRSTRLSSASISVGALLTGAH